MSQRRAALQSYFYAVLQDLMNRGVIRQAGGQRLDEILRAELPAVMASVREDFKAAGIEIATTLMGAGERMLEDFAHKQIRGFSERLASLFRAPR